MLVDAGYGQSRVDANRFDRAAMRAFERPALHVAGLFDAREMDLGPAAIAFQMIGANIVIAKKLREIPHFKYLFNLKLRYDNRSTSGMKLRICVSMSGDTNHRSFRFKKITISNSLQ